MIKLIGQFNDAFNNTEYKKVSLTGWYGDVVGRTEGLKSLNPPNALGPAELYPRVLKELLMS